MGKLFIHTQRPIQLHARYPEHFRTSSEGVQELSMTYKIPKEILIVKSMRRKKRCSRGGETTSFLLVVNIPVWFSWEV